MDERRNALDEYLGFQSTKHYVYLGTDFVYHNPFRPEDYLHVIHRNEIKDYIEQNLIYLTSFPVLPDLPIFKKAKSLLGLSKHVLSEQEKKTVREIIIQNEDSLSIICGFDNLENPSKINDYWIFPTKEVAKNKLKRLI